MSLAAKLKEHAWTTAVGAALAIVGAAALAGSLSWADGRYVLLEIYTTDQMSRGVLTVDMQIRQVDWRLRDASQQYVEAQVREDARAIAQAEADRTFYTAEKETLLRRRSDLLRRQ